MDDTDEDRINPWAPRLERKSARLRGFDYRARCMYHIVIVTQLRHHRFGTIRNGRMQYSPAGLMVEEAWNEIPAKFPDAHLDSYVVMPNHFHGLVLLVDLEGHPHHRLGEVVQWFKSATTNRYIHGVRDQGWPSFEKRLWQAEYYDHIARSDADIDRIRTYIAENPVTWERDRLNN